MDFRPFVVLDSIGYLIQGVTLTLGLSIAAIVIGLILGSFGAVLRRSAIAPARWIVAAYVDVFRSTPSLVQLYFFFFGLPAIGIKLSPLAAAVLALSLYSGAYCTEILRAGFESVHPGQIMAARSIGMNRWQSFRHVVAPQAVRIVMPPLASQFIDTTLTSSLASLVGIFEVTERAVFLVSETFRPFEIYLVLGLIYLGLTSALVLVFGQIERRIGVHRRLHVLPMEIEDVLPPEDNRATGAA
jgi:polar amino acid transport system permease protein